MTLTSGKRIGAMALAAGILVAACGGSAATTAPAATDASGATEAPAGSQGAAVSGTIFVSGSSTVEPISTGVAEALAAANPEFKFTVEGPGTGDGFQKFCAGETDISDASRKIKDEEAKLCADAGIEYVELKVAIDGMSVLTSVNNTAIACLSFPDLYALIGPESTGFAKWSDGAAIAKELGSNTALPDAELVDHRSRRGVGHLRQLRRARDREDRRGAWPGAQHPARLHGFAERQRDHRRHLRHRHLARLGGLRLRRGEQEQGQRDRHRQGGQRRRASHPRLRPLPTAPIPCPDPCSST